MKLICVTWWVISGLWKGITAASIGRLMKSAGYSITIAKMDPYLQIDAGTMSPYEHWEVFVTEDWWETDLDLWHYERFIDEDLTKGASITTWQIYLSVIKKERRWDYLGQTVQVIPHVINEIKNRIKRISQTKDITILEIGWTIWDIEWPHFIEAMRQLRQELWKENVLFIHVAPILQVTTSWEMKTKAIQHSIVKLREFWIYANILVCRTTKKIDNNIKKKLSLFCDIKPERIIEAFDQNIYQVPLAFKEQNLDKIIIERFFGKTKYADMTSRQAHVDHLIHPQQTTTIAIAGKYTHLDDCYLSVIESLKHAWAYYQTKINIERIDTEKLEEENREEKLDNIIKNKQISGILVPWAFWSRGVEWMINIWDYARRYDIPYLWICMWLQTATISFIRNVCGLEDANSTEFSKNTKHPVIDIMKNQKNIQKKWWTMRLWSYPAILREDTITLELYKTFDSPNKERGHLVQERHRHRYEVNPNYHNIMEKNWLTISGKSPDGSLVEFIELKDHIFYVATQAHPELKSRLNKPHPLFLWLISSCIK